MEKKIEKFYTSINDYRELRDEIETVILYLDEVANNLTKKPVHAGLLLGRAYKILKDRLEKINFEID